MFIFNLANFRIVKPQVVGKTTRREQTQTTRIKVNFSDRRMVGKTIKTNRKDKKEQNRWFQK